MDEDPFDKNAQSFSKLHREVLLLFKIFTELNLRLRI